jgi:hypothetical protein
MSFKQFEFDWDAEPLDEKEPQACTASAKVLDRIKKLLRLARDKAATPAEAERAAAIAFDLAERHHVDVANLNLSDAGEELGGEYFQAGRMDRLTKGLLGVASAYFHVEVCVCRKRVLLVGRTTDVQIAGYVFDFLRRSGRECLRSYEAAEKRQRRRMTPLKRGNFLAGFVWGVRSKLAETREHLQLTESQTALVLAEGAAREEKMAELVPNTRKLPERKQRLIRSAALCGYVSGRNTRIHQPLRGTPGNERLALA